MYRPAGAFPWVLATLVVLFSGCAARRPQTYRLIPQDRARILAPPGVVRTAIPVTVAAAVRDWRPDCAPSGEGIVAQGRGKHVRLTIGAAALAQKPAGWLADWLAAAEALGCLGASDNVALATQILQAVPLDPAVAYRLLHAGTIQKGYIDLGAETRLQVVTPILKTGAAADAPLIETLGVSGGGNQVNVTARATDSLVGVETAWYGFQPKPAGAGWRITPLDVERRIDGRPETAAAPLSNYFRFSDRAAHYRLFYKTDPDGDGTTEIVLTAPTRAELDRRTRALAGDASLCQRSDPEMCVVIPRRVAVNPFVAVAVNGTETRLPVGSTVRRAIEQVDARANLPEILSRLKLLKPHGGKLARVEFDRTRQDILDLTLLGGESLSW
jgi:hypothetical protein